MSNYTITKEEKLPTSEIEIEGAIATEYLQTFRSHAISHINEEITLPGFRKGHIPESILVKKVGELFLLEEMSNLALQEIVPKIITDKKIDVLGRPEVRIVKLAEGTPVVFKIKCALMPEVKLPDYKKIARDSNAKNKDEKIAIEEKEIDAVIDGIRKNFAEGAEKKLPELTPEFVAKLGEFKSVEDFRAKIKENVTKEKEYRAKEKHRIEIVEAIIAKSDIAVPAILIEGELDRMEAEFKNDVARMNLKFDDYLTHAKKTIEDIRKDWGPDALKRVQFQLVMGKIAVNEKLQPEAEKVEHEVKHLLEHYKDADPIRARGYVEHMLTNEEVFKFLETA